MLNINGKLWVLADYAHIRIPKRMLRDPQYKLLSPEAKMVYGAMMDRTSLSHNNQSIFKNSSGEIFIFFSQSEIMHLLGCGHDKATKVQKELIDKGLIKVKRRGVGRPYEIVLQPVDWRLPQKNENKQSEKPLCDSGKADYSLCDNTADNNTEYINPDIMDLKYHLCRYLKHEIDYDELICQYDPPIIDRILDVASNTICQETESILLSNILVPAETIKESLRNLKKGHILYAIKKIKNATYTKDHSDIFILNALYESIKRQSP